ncbi:Allantoate permease [Clarireedia jacksonii]
MPCEIKEVDVLEKTAMDSKSAEMPFEGQPDNIELGEVFEHPTVAEEKSVLRKIDWHLMPLLTFSYFLQFLDKSSLNYSSVLGIQKDTHLVGQQYSWLSSVFYFGYLVANYPASLGFVKLPLAKFLSVSM